MDLTSALVDIYQTSFPESLDGPRTIGPEEEYIIVDRNGQPGFVSHIYPELIRQDWEPEFDPITGYIVAVKSGKLCIGTDVGVSQLEIGFSPVTNLIDHEEERQGLLEVVDDLLKSVGLIRIRDYGAHPIAKATRDLWAPKVRSLFFRDHLVDSVHPQTISAASQCHFQVALDEIVPVIKVLDALSGVFIALSANSPVWSGQLDPDHSLAARQLFWERFTIDHGYKNNVWLQKPYPKDLEELVRRTTKATFLLYLRDQELEVPGCTFQNWATQHGEIDLDRLHDAYQAHMGTLWWNVRPRTCYGTVERRICCQSYLALPLHALTLGLIENLDQAIAFLDQHRPDSGWRQFYRETLYHGLDTNPNGETALLCQDLIEIAEAGLVERGFGEQVLLYPLDQLIDSGHSPAHDKLEIFEREGAEGLLRHLLT